MLINTWSGGVNTSQVFNRVTTMRGYSPPTIGVPLQTMATTDGVAARSRRLSNALIKSSSALTVVVTQMDASTRGYAE